MVFFCSWEKKYISRIEFARIPRLLKELPRWKSAEFRVFLHYVGIVVWKPFRPSTLYQHFDCLPVAVKLLSDKIRCRSYSTYAHDLLLYFVKKGALLLDKNFVSYNVHNVMHVAADDERLGPLYSFSAYRFESFYGLLKKYLRKNDKPLQQPIKRLEEDRRHLKMPLVCQPNVCNGFSKLSKNHLSGLVLENFSWSQLRNLESVGKFKISCTIPDNCVFLKDFKIFQIRNILKMNNRISILSNKFLDQSDYYVSPLPSSSLKKFLVSKLSRIQI